MSIEGGIFICYKHEYETHDVKKWDKHCHETGHILEVNQKCKKCGQDNIVRDYPYPERYVERAHSNLEDNVILLKCPNCE
jgi:hypothetical protein